MSTLLIFNFDGTSNEPSDAEQNVNHLGIIKDDNISNIVKFHLLCGGNLKGINNQVDSSSNSSQKCFYYQGVGTYGSRFSQVINALISPENSDVASILKQAKADFFQHFQAGDDVLLTGFSRGGALARRFCAIISEEMPELNVYQAIFDTVASIGLPNLSKGERPKSEVVFEYGHTLASTVKQALHMVSLDDKRKAFQPTLMNHDERILELWFSGAHSDVGGGYYQDGLSDITLQFMIDWLEKLPISLALRNVVDIDFKMVLPAEVSYQISIDDIEITPDAFGKNHQQDRLAIIDWLTLTDRQCCVIVKDKITDILPTVNHTVTQRINGDITYQPSSLAALDYKVFYSDGKKNS